MIRPLIRTALEVSERVAARVQRMSRAIALHTWARQRIRYAATNVVEYVFVDPEDWDGRGEIVEDPGVVSFWRREYIKWIAHVSSGANTPTHVLKILEQNAPTERRTQLVRRPAR